METWLVTGADRGIGAAICSQLVERGKTAIAACLRDAPETAVPGVEVIKGVDVTSAASVQSLFEKVSQRRIDVLVHNAGRVSQEPFGHLDFDAMQLDYAVNALGPLRVTQALMPCLGSGSKIGVITSRVGSLGENGSGGLWGYRMSKAAANMAVLNLAHELRDRGIAVMALHPGSVRTQMTAGLVDARTVGTLMSPEESAEGLIDRLEQLELPSSGTFFHANGERLPW